MTLIKDGTWTETYGPNRLDYFAAHAPAASAAYIEGIIKDERQRNKPLRSPLEIHCDLAWEYAEMMIARGELRRNK